VALTACELSADEMLLAGDWSRRLACDRRVGGGGGRGVRWGGGDDCTAQLSTTDNSRSN
jgi:hypothetical protein